MLNSPVLSITGYLTYLVYKRVFIFQFNQFLDSRAEIHQIFVCWFFGKLKTPKSPSGTKRPLVTILKAMI